MALIQASYGGFSFWAQDFQGPDGIRIVKHPAYGRYGVSTEVTGSDGRHEQISAILTDAEYAKLRKIIHEGKVRVFTHPRLGTFRALGNIMSRAGMPGSVGKLQVQLEFIEDTDPQPAGPFDDQAPDSKKLAAKTLFDDTDETMSGTPGDSTTQALYGDFQTARTAYDAAVDDWEAERGDWQNVELALGKLKTTGWAVVENLRAFDSLQEGSYSVQGQLIRGIALCHDFVQAIRNQQQKWFLVQTEAVADIYSLCLEIYGEDNEDALDQAQKIIDRNDLLDQFYIEARSVLEFPIL
jgi:hypothetical protein